MSTIRVPEADAAGWRCACCDCDLVLAPVELEYMGSHFSVELPACPQCGAVLVPEPLALGKMAEVEKLLEDK
ncbi:MAG: DNA-binding protein [Desulfovibrionaceae bacterium]|jgi:hypothetical protein|nr:DNA-binding protein [Desulfovibrionaceae bacterium]